MIWMELTGGLGNQLFIWSAAHEVSRRFSEDVCLFYVGNSESREDRPIEITELARKCSHGIHLKKMNSLGYVLRLFDYFSRNQKMRIALSKFMKFYDSGSPFESLSAELKKPRLIRGYFQNEGLVEACRDMIESELVSELRTHQSKMDVYSQQLAIGTVCHVRRGDTNEMLDSVGQLSVKFYENYWDPEEKILIFSDSLEIREEFEHLPVSVIYFTADKFSAWESFNAMSRATKLIMANSTLSWWSAKLAIWSHDVDVYIPSPWMKSLSLEEGLTLKEAQPKRAIYV